MDVGFGEALIGIAEEGAVEILQRLAVLRRQATISRAAVVEKFVRQINAGVRSRCPSQGRVDGVAFQVDVPAEALAILVDAVDAQADAIAERLIDIAGQADAAFAVADDGKVAPGPEVRSLH